MSRIGKKPVALPAGVTATVESGAAADPEPLRWLMESDVCKHCTHAGCLDVCPTGSLFRTEFGTVVVQEDICNGCGYCVPACPFGVLDKRHLPRKPDDAPLALPLFGTKEDGRVWKCTLCYDRLKGGHEPACAKACPTDSIQFGFRDELAAKAQRRVEALKAQGSKDAQLYGADQNGFLGGLNAFFLLLSKPSVYKLPDSPKLPQRNVVVDSLLSIGSALAVGLGVVVAFRDRGRRNGGGDA